MQIRSRCIDPTSIQRAPDNIARQMAGQICTDVIILNFRYRLRRGKSRGQLQVCNALLHQFGKIGRVDEVTPGWPLCSTTKPSHSLLTYPAKPPKVEDRIYDRVSLGLLDPESVAINEWSANV